ncbi:MAG: pyridoxal-phosphate dependent enzyme [Pseudomonadota bacterium]|nr:pyridoxal-phosphate dependent enzyme [Pseudomonadota bacterium]
MSLHIATPLLASSAIPTRAGQTVWLKMEAMQPIGSFKLRGIGHACTEYQRRGAKRFISSSGGNAGIAAAYAGRQLGVPVLVVVPETASPRARALIAREGADIVVHGANFDEANAHAQSLVTVGDAFIHPYDDPLLWEGHATMIDEIAAAGVKPDAVVLSVGGGGLLCGVMAGLRRHGWDDVPVIAVETAGADAFAQSVLAGKRVELAAVTSIATSLGARSVASQALTLAREHPVRSHVVSDNDAVQGCMRLMDDHRVVVEPACGAALAIGYQATTLLKEFDNVVVIVCGGVTATVEQLQQWSEIAERRLGPRSA